MRYTLIHIHLKSIRKMDFNKKLNNLLKWFTLPSVRYDNVANVVNSMKLWAFEKSKLLTRLIVIIMISIKYFLYTMYFVHFFFLFIFEEQCKSPYESNIRITLPTKQQYENEKYQNYAFEQKYNILRVIMGVHFS